MKKEREREKIEMKDSCGLSDTLIVGGAAGGHLSTLSISSCALSANDIKPLYSALKQGMKLQMLKLAGNRLEDPGVVGLAEALAANKTHPLAVLDVSDNTVSSPNWEYFLLRKDSYGYQLVLIGDMSFLKSHVYKVTLYMQNSEHVIITYLHVYTQGQDLAVDLSL